MSYQPNNPNGQEVMANSSPVVIASDQSPVDVSGPLTDTELRATPVPVSGTVDVTATNLDIRDLAFATDKVDASGSVLGAGNNNIGDVDVATLPGVQFQDLYITGQGSQTALNQNVILASAGTGSVDTLNGTTGISFRSIAIQITPASGTVTAGVITFEGSNDNFVATAVPVFLSDGANVTAIPVSTYTLAANTTRYFRGAVPYRYFRARISTGVTGTTTGVQAFTVLSTVPFSDTRLTVSQATAASLNTTVTGTITAVTNITNWGNIVDDAAVTPATTRVLMSGYMADETATDSVDEGDGGMARMTLNRRQITAGNVLDDAAFGVGTEYVNTIAGLADETATDSVDEGDTGALRMTLNRRLITAGQMADDAAFTVGTDYGTPASFLADETSTDSVDEGDVGVARMTLDRKQIVTSYPSATGTAEGLLVANFNTGDTYTALTNSAQVIKATAGNLYGYYIYNPNSAATYVMVYNIAAASVTVGTSTAQMVFCIPATSGANLMFPYPISFTNAGWSIAAATTGNGNTAPATALEAMIWYR